jgi:hypothetical protein
MRNHCAIALLAVLGGCDSSQPAPDYPPFLVDSTPGVGAIITGAVGAEREVIATVGDENLADSLFIRFLVDYPMDYPAPGTSLLFQVAVPPNGAVERGPVRLQPSCHTFALAPGLHRLTMSVSDRPYLDPAHGDDVEPNAPLDSVPFEAHRLRTVWLLSCP